MLQSLSIHHAVVALIVVTVIVVTLVVVAGAVAAMGSAPGAGRLVIAATVLQMAVGVFGAAWITWLCWMISRNNPRTAFALFGTMSGWWLWFVVSSFRGNLEERRARATDQDA